MILSLLVAILAIWLVSPTLEAQNVPRLPPDLKEIIFTSAPAAGDYAEMLSNHTDPRYDWSKARPYITTIKHYAEHLTRVPNPSTGSNTYNILSGLGVFRKVRESRERGGLGLQQSIEVSALKHHNCTRTSVSEFDHVTNESADTALQIYRAGGNLRSLAVDSAMVGGNDCPVGRMSPEQVARWMVSWTGWVRSKVTAGLTEMRRLDPNLPVIPLRIGAIEPYPGFPVGTHKAYITSENAELRRANLPILDFYHLDVDFGPIKDFEVMARDIRDLSAFVRSQGMSFGLIVWGDDSKSPSTDNELFYVTTANKKLTTFKQYDLFSVIDELVIQSWSSDSRGNKWNPTNVPETNRLSHMAFVRHAIGCIANEFSCTPYP